MEALTIQTKAGRYDGTREPSGVVSFKGIPFAKPPVGTLRWQPPQPLETFDSKRQADIYPPAPIQLNYPKHLADQMGEPIHIPISEDCLYLNVWTADLETPKKGILFWIYGGSYAIGHASRVQSRGEAFVAAHPEIVVVAPNYRLGVFGSIDLSMFGAGEEYAWSNNLNLLDHRAALRWTRENAHLFGADPDTITLYGHSAGSNAICHHLASPDSLPLFRRAICQSSFLQGPPPRSLASAKDASGKIFEYLGIFTLEAALSVSADRLLCAQEQVFGEIYGSPVIDGLVVHDDEFASLASGIAADKDVMVGYSNGERDGAFAGLSDEEAIAKVRSSYEALLKRDETAFERYLSRHEEEDILRACKDAQAELAMTIPAELMARALSLKGTVYQFQFSWADPASGVRAPHGAPCPFVFGNQVPASAPSALCRQVQDSWARFIATGDPNHAGIPEWEPYTFCGGSVMVIDAEWKPVPGFWDDDYPLFAPLFDDYRVLREVTGDGD